MIQGQMPQNDKLDQRIQTANIAGSITFDFIKSLEKHYDKLRDGEIFDVLNQLSDPGNSILYGKIMTILENDIQAIFNPQ